MTDGFVKRAGQNRPRTKKRAKTFLKKNRGKFVPNQKRGRAQW